MSKSIVFMVKKIDYSSCIKAERPPSIRIVVPLIKLAIGEAK